MSIGYVTKENQVNLFNWTKKIEWLQLQAWKFFCITIHCAVFSRLRLVISISNFFHPNVRLRFFYGNQKICSTSVLNFCDWISVLFVGIGKVVFVFFRILSWLYASAILDLNRGDASLGIQIAKRRVRVSESTLCIRMKSGHFCMATLWTLNMYRLQIIASGKMRSMKWMHLDTGW